MSLSIRPLTGEADYSSAAELLTASGYELPELYQLQASDTQDLSSTVRRCTVAVDADDTIVGTSFIQYEPWMPTGHFDLFLAVAPAHRQRGIGSQLYNDTVAYAKSHGATALLATLSDRVPQARSFAEHHGFALQQHWVYWQLQLDTFQEAPFHDVLTQQQARGIRFTTLADAGNTRETQLKLYELNRQTSLEAPGEDSFPTFDEFVRDIVDASWFRPDSQIVATDGERWIGLGAVGIDGERAFNAFTGVDRDYRRQGLATALTLLTIRYARQHNATYLEVFNDSRNSPMFMLQERLGYYRSPGRYIMRQTLA